MRSRWNSVSSAYRSASSKRSISLSRAAAPVTTRGSTWASFPVCRDTTPGREIEPQSASVAHPGVLHPQHLQAVRPFAAAADHLADEQRVAAAVELRWRSSHSTHAAASARIGAPGEAGPKGEPGQAFGVAVVVERLHELADDRPLRPGQDVEGKDPVCGRRA